MSKSRKKKKFPSAEEQNLEASLIAKSINQEESKMENTTPNQTPATEAKATAAPAQTQTAPAAQQSAAAPAETQAPAQAAPTAQQTSAKPQPAPAQAAAPAQPQASAQAPAPTQVQQAPAHWSEKCGDPQVVAAMAVAQAFINAHPSEAESVGLLILNSTSPAEFQNLLNQKEKSIMSNTTNATASAPTVTPAPAAVTPTVLPAIPVVAGEDRKSFSGWTTTEMIVVGIGAAALIGVSIWAVCATIKANKYKAALADAVSNSGM